VVDHIIIGDNCYYSFADACLIAKYEKDFLNLRLRMNLSKKTELVLE
jgi:DNA repair protein RadC